MGLVWTALVAVAVATAAVNGRMAALTAAAMESAGKAVTLAAAGETVVLTHTGTGPMLPIETATSQLAQRTLTVSARFSAFAHQPETFV